MLKLIYYSKLIITLSFAASILLTAYNTFLTLYCGIYTDGGFFINLCILLLPIAVVHLFGMFDGAQTVRKDAAEQSIFWNNTLTMSDYTMESSVYSPAEKWFIGGNYKFPPGTPFRSDFWHWCKWMWTLCISLLATSTVMAVIVLPHEWKYYTLLYGFMYGVEGFSFTFYYSYIFRKDRTWKWYWNHITHPEW